MRVHDPRTAADYQRLWEDSEFWSCFGFDGLAILFDLPEQEFRSLQEDEKRSLMNLLKKMTEQHNDSLRSRVQAAEHQPDDERLAVLLSISEPLRQINDGNEDPSIAPF